MTVEASRRVGDHAWPPTVLVVSADDASRKRLSRGLRGSCEALLAKGAMEAARLYEKHTARIALLITDLEMPRVDGEALIDWLRVADPGLPVIAVTGDRESGRARRVLRKEKVAVLPKPLDVEAARNLIEALTGQAGD